MGRQVGLPRVEFYERKVGRTSVVFDGREDRLPRVMFEGREVGLLRVEFYGRKVGLTNVVFDGSGMGYHVSCSRGVRLDFRGTSSMGGRVD